MSATGHSASPSPPTPATIRIPSAHAGLPALTDEPLRIGDRTFKSRLILGTGKYQTYDLMRQALDVSNSEVITVAVRRERLINEKGESLLKFIDTDRYTILPNTAGCFTAEDAVRVARLGREILEQIGNPGASWVKLEVLGDKKTLLPDPIATAQATKELVNDGFQVLAYSSDDPIAAVRIKEAGATSVMPAGSPIGSGQGVLNRNNVLLCLELLKHNDPKYPVILDAGVGSASDVAIAMELGADAVLLNTAVAHAANPVLMADAMRHACIAGRQSYLSGRIAKKLYASASSPWEGTISYIPGE